MTDRFSAPFVAMFEALRMAPTFARGRRDARAGHVRHLSISSSLVVAQVRGPDDARPFRARIAVRAFGAAEWARVESALAAQARNTADLLAGRMPPGIEEVFRGEDLTLLPLSLNEVAMDCTCERWPMPCIHLAATCYALAESFETDPFGVFAWRGRGRDELLTHLTELRVVPAQELAGSGSAGSGAGAAAGAPGAGGAADGAGVTSPEGQPTRDLADHADFWGMSGREAVRAARPPAVVRPDLLLDQLDAPPLRYGRQSLTELLRPAYRALPPETPPS